MVPRPADPVSLALLNVECQPPGRVAGSRSEMPTYEYRCRDCGEQLEVVQAFTDDNLTECGTCGGSLRKLFSAVGISFKGSGFYKTDSRNGSGERKGDKADKGEKADKGDKASANGGGGAKEGGSSSSSEKGAGDAKPASAPAKDGSSTKAPDTAKAAKPAKTV